MDRDREMSAAACRLANTILQRANGYCPDTDLQKLKKALYIAHCIVCDEIDELEELEQEEQEQVQEDRAEEERLLAGLQGLDSDEA
jgi:nucleoside-triphosphatase THEP1